MNAEKEALFQISRRFVRGDKRLPRLWPLTHLSARLLRRGLASVEMTKAARDLCRAAFGDELPGTPVPFIA
jgi:hypothetical protein